MATKKIIKIENEVELKFWQDRFRDFESRAERAPITSGFSNALSPQKDKYKTVQECINYADECLKSLKERNKNSYSSK